ncbi:hypothetical protein BG004_005038 [Podila humilis]|nr:hypothetical protein BG004_005038 [Podila humilis]
MVAMHPFDLPELRYRIATFLVHETKSLAACARVCKCWNQVFNPFVWRQLSATVLLPRGHLHRQALEHNGHLIEDLTIGKLDQTRYCLDHISRLKILQIEDERLVGLSQDPIENIFLNLEHFNQNGVQINKNEWMGQLQTLLRQNKSLKRLRLKMDRFEPTPQFWETVVQACQNLVEIQCVFATLTLSQLEPFLATCSATRIQSLVLQHCQFDPFQIEILAQYSFDSITSLTIAINANLDVEHQLQWMRCCPNIENLTWIVVRTFSQTTVVSEFCTILSDHCPKIEALVISNHQFEAHHLARILYSAHRLNKLVLKSDSGTSSMLNDSEVMTALSKHFDYLREVEFGQDQIHVEWKSVLRFLMRCPRLESLVAHGRVSIQNAVNTNDNLQLNMEEVNVAQVNSPGTESVVVGERDGEDTPEPNLPSQAEASQQWVCLGLHKLQVTLTLPEPSITMRYPPRVGTSTAAPSASHFMTQQNLMIQIGRLTKLRELLLGQGSMLLMYEFSHSHYRGLDFRLSAGLQKLAGLVGLERLNIDGTPQQLGTAEIMWMLRQWPMLRLIEGELHSRTEERVALEDMLRSFGFQTQRGRAQRW